MQVMEVDDSQFPLVVVRWRGRATDADLDGFWVVFDGWLRQDTTIALLLDSRGAQGVSSDQRHRIVTEIKNRSALLERNLIQAVVFDNPIQRALYFAVAWAFPMPFPSKSFGDVDSARVWLQLQLKHRGQSPRPTLPV
jgi:hypothetical protein